MVMQPLEQRRCKILAERNDASFEEWDLYEDQERLKGLFNRLAKSEEGRRVTELCLTKRTEVIFARNMGKDGTVGCAWPGLVLLGAEEKDDRLVHILAHEFRHVEQHMKSDDDLIFRPEFLCSLPENVLIRNRVSEGDAFAFGILVSWQLNRAGDTRPFHDLMRDLGHKTAELLKPYLQTFMENPAETMKGLFLVVQDRIGCYDKSIIDYITEMTRDSSLLRDIHDYIRSSPSQRTDPYSAFFNEVAGRHGYLKVAGEKNYFRADDAEGFVEFVMKGMSRVNRLKFEEARRGFLGL